MTLPGATVLDVAFVFAVTGAALVWPPTALFVAAGFFGLTAFLADRRAVAPAPPES